MNWGWKIAITYSTFAVGVLAIVFFTAMKKVNLVEKDYYEKEIKYQEQIERIKNAQALGENFQIAFDETSETLNISSKGQEVSDGTIHLFRPSDSDKDVNLGLNLDNSGSQTIDVKSLQKGLWIAKVNWVSEGKSFYKSIPIELK